MRPAVPFFLAMTLSSSVALAAQYVVSPTGVDSGAGPWKTLQYAVSRVVGGDTVLVENGTYAGFCFKYKQYTSRVTFRARNKWGAHITTPNSLCGNTDGINGFSSSTITIDGFRISGMQRSGINFTSWDTEDGSDTRDNIFQNNWLHNNGTIATGRHNGIFTGFALNVIIQDNLIENSAEHGIYVSNSADNPIIRRNTVRNNARQGIQINADWSMGGDGLITNWEISNNIVHGNAPDSNGSAAINLDGAQHGRLFNNLIYNNGRGGIVLGYYNGAEGSSFNVISNNTIYNPAGTKKAIVNYELAEGNLIFNNILFSGNGAIDSADAGPGNIHDYNIVSPAFSGDQAAAHELVVSPESVFVNPSTFDLRLKAGSPGINAGVASFQGQTAASTDLGGASRPQGGTPDTGCYESGSTAVNNPPIARAGADQSVAPGATVTLNGLESSDPNGDAISFEWTQTAGPTVALSNREVPQPTFTAPPVSTTTVVSFALVVSDSQYDSAADTVDIVVRPATTPEFNIDVTATDTPRSIPDNFPAGITSQVQVSSGGSVTKMEVVLDVTHPYIGDLLIKLQCPSGAVAELENASSGDVDNIHKAYPVTACNNQSASGTYRLLVSDVGPGDAGTLERFRLRIQTSGSTQPPANLAPSANAGPDQSVTAGASVTLDGTASSDPERAALTYEWVQTLGPAATLSNARTARPTFVAPAVTTATTLTFGLTVNDGAQSSTRDTVNVNVQPLPTGPVTVTATDTPKTIPDNNAIGITSAIAVNADGTIKGLSADVRITHPYIGDLLVRLQCPNGTLVTLHERAGGSADNIYKTFPVTGCNGQAVRGTYRLLVSDPAAYDVGTLDTWTLTVQR